MYAITLRDYNAIHPDYRSVWRTERTDMADWDKIRPTVMGKRTLMREGGLIIEGIHFVITEDEQMKYATLKVGDTFQLHSDEDVYIRCRGGYRRARGGPLYSPCQITRNRMNVILYRRAA